MLLGLRPWSSLVRREQEQGERVSDIEEDVEVSLSTPAHYTLLDQVVASSPLKAYRRPYSRKEQQEVVGHLVARRSWGLVKGNTVWQGMEEAGVCGGRRTWQSMKEHFRKQIMAKIHTFGLDWTTVGLHWTR